MFPTPSVKPNIILVLYSPLYYSQTITPPSIVTQYNRDRVQVTWQRARLVSDLGSRVQVCTPTKPNLGIFSRSKPRPAPLSDRVLAGFLPGFHFIFIGHHNMWANRPFVHIEVNVIAVRAEVSLELITRCPCRAPLMQQSRTFI
jgi:hypothetical protein